MLAYPASAEDAREPGGIMVFDRMLNRWRRNNPVELAAVVEEVEARQMYYSLVVRMLKEWNQNCPRIRKHRAVRGTVKRVKLLLVELPEEFGGGLERIVLEESEEDDFKTEAKLKHPLTGLHIEMALSLQHEGHRGTWWAMQLASGSKSQKNRTEELLAHEPDTPCAIDFLVGAVEHISSTLRTPIVTPGDEMFANAAMLNDTSLAGKTKRLLQGLLRGLKKLQKEPHIPDAGGFLSSLLLRNPRHWAGRPNGAKAAFFFYGASGLRVFGFLVFGV